ncbi:hypothetical protein DESUT3_23660 [Desulfuromonas versatilis]|uniref:Transposase IS200-like domain-containing protein n=1 Tax=Desulfuromonas versatilis TaxID=2802975 RepID=A0ABM8HX48_9BACT|nr:hypothetical protein [Desulfuromonas versatilis]BCR05297.1 hypothetical protein DESUT3_23660 [Desulfuromonas versatilis]
MDNHFHLLLRHQRSGHLFQDRYKSIVCDKDNYLLELIRYIRLNPLRAGVLNRLEDLDSSAWTGHSVLMGHQELNGQQTDAALSLFCKGLTEARKEYRQFISEGFEAGPDIALDGGGKRRSRALDPVLGEEDLFDDRILGGGAGGQYRR